MLSSILLIELYIAISHRFEQSNTILILLKGFFFENSVMYVLLVSFEVNRMNDPSNVIRTRINIRHNYGFNDKAFLKRYAKHYPLFSTF